MKKFNEQHALKLADELATSARAYLIDAHKSNMITRLTEFTQCLQNYEEYNSINNASDEINKSEINFSAINMDKIFPNEYSIMINKAYPNSKPCAITEEEYEFYFKKLKIHHPNATFHEIMKWNKGLINPVIVMKYIESKKSITDSSKLDCPFDFTSRCSMGSCDCQPTVKQ